MNLEDRFEKFLICEDELQVVLNELYKESEKFEIMLPFTLREPALEINFKTLEIKINVGKNDFQLPVKTAKKVKSEISNYGDVLDALFSAGILKPENENEIINFLKNKMTEAEKFTSSPRPFAIAFDTNCFMLKVPSNLLQKELRKIPCVYSELVLEELGLLAQHKLNGIIEHLKQLYPSSAHELSFLRHCETRIARRAKMGIAEVNKLQIEHAGKTIGAKPPNNFSTLSSIERDNQIIESYVNYQEERKVELIFLTTDNNANIRAATKGLATFYIKQPTNLSNIKINYKSLTKLFYTLSVMFGYIKLRTGFTTTLIYSTWPGKTFNEWKNNLMKILIPKDTKATQNIRKHLAVLRT